MEAKKYYLFSLSLFVFQMIGYNIISIGLLLVSLLPILSMSVFIDKLRTVPFYFFFLTFSIIIGLYFGLADGFKSWTIPYWGQFYFFSFVLLAVKDKSATIAAIKYCVFVIFFADLFTNLLLLAGFDVPWSIKPVLRAGETLARYTGIKGNTLYSGSISFISLCFLLNEKYKSICLKYLFLLALVFNIILSGSYRYFIISFVVFALYYMHLYRYRFLLFSMYVCCIIIVYIATKYTMLLSASNFLRFMIWDHFIGEVGKAPLLGHGFFNMRLDNVGEFSYQSLIASGVTESCVLLLGYCFGIPILCLFLLSVCITLWRFRRYTAYYVELALFLGLSLDLFWGGSFDNSLSLTVLTLSLYMINDIRQEGRFYCRKGVTHES